MKSNTQLLLENIFFSTLSIGKLLLMTKARAVKNISKLKSNNSCLILGNGPSLKNDFATIEKIKNKVDILCVNYFANSDYYVRLTPVHYVLNAPEMWMDDVSEKLIQMGDSLFNELAKKTTWEMNLHIPIGAKKYSRWQKKIVSNQKIKVHYFNTTPVEGFNSLLKKAIYKGWGMPRPHNVLIPSLVISLRAKYQKIYLFGADHSWLKDIWVTDANQVLLTQKHFYDEDTAKASPMHKMGKGSRTIAEVLQKFTYSFQAYELLNRFAEQEKQYILNATTGSYIDAFQRIKDLPSS